MNKDLYCGEIIIPRQYSIPIMPEGFTTITKPQLHPIMPEGFTTITKPQPHPIMPEGFITGTTIMIPSGYSDFIFSKKVHDKIKQFPGERTIDDLFLG